MADQQLKPYVIHYLDRDGNLFVFKCMAEDSRHAIEQLKNADPNTRIIGLKREAK